MGNYRNADRIGCVFVYIRLSQKISKFSVVTITNQVSVCSESGGIRMSKKVAVIMGSDSDLPVVKGALDELDKFGIPYEVHVMSAHRTPALAAEFAGNAKKNGFGIILSAAGKAAHLGGVLAAHTTLPVIGIPVKSSTLDGLDALLATVQMPKGIPVATVAIDGAANAAILAAQMLALSDPVIDAKLEQMKIDMENGVKEKDAKISAEYGNC